MNLCAYDLCTNIVRESQYFCEECLNRGIPHMDPPTVKCIKDRGKKDMYEINNTTTYVNRDLYDLMIENNKLLKELLVRLGNNTVDVKLKDVIIQMYKNDPNIISCIKYFRDQTGMYLKESKDAVEAILHEAHLR